jgi:hypothetical protein
LVASILEIRSNHLVYSIRGATPESILQYGQAHNAIAGTSYIAFTADALRKVR